MVSRKKPGGNAPSLKVVLRDSAGEATAPRVAFHAVSSDGKVLASAEAGSGDPLGIPGAALGKAAFLAVLPTDVEPSREAISSSYRISTRQVARLMETKKVLELSPARWRPLLPFIRCVDGRVRKCWWWPFYVKALNDIAVARLAPLSPSASGALGPALPALPRRPFLPPIFRRCKPVCEGLVEVYQRVCCCRIVITPPIIIDLIDRLREIVQRLPDPDPGPIRPPRPQPDPVPFERAGVFRGGVVDKLAINAAADLHVLADAPFERAEAYIRARPYLVRILCHCGPAVFKGSGLIGPGGEFTVCYPDSPFLLPHCHVEWAFRVRQVIDGVDTVIYDGLAADEWFDPGDDITLTTHHPQAADCDDEPAPVPDDVPFAMLEDIGSTDAWELKTPSPTGWDRATVTSYNDGLGLPAASVAAARGKNRNRNWGGVLPLRYRITEPMKAVGARYYRVSVSEADDTGQPTGTRRYLDTPISWQYYESLGGFPPAIRTGRKQLNLEDDPTFYEIPYRSDRNWLSDGFHAMVDTRAFADKRHLVTLELYDAGRNRIVPGNALDPGAGDTARPFTYEWWKANPATPDVMPEFTTNVPYAGLTHMFWWDNRRAVAEIVDLRKGGLKNTAECQFMSGNAGSLFSAGFRAFHPHEWFMHSYELRWRRGLGGPSKTLETGVVNKGVMGAEGSNAATFDEMLNYSPAHPPSDMLPPGERNEKCTFSLLLHVDVKTFNGSGTLDGLDDDDVASFALDIS